MQQTPDFDSFFEAYKSSVLKKQVDRLLALYDEDITAYDMWGRWSYVGAGPWREMNEGWLGSLGSETVVVDFDDVSAVHGADSRSRVRDGNLQSRVGNGRDVAVNAKPPDLGGEAQERRLENRPSTYVSAHRS